jgi:hypothetical protein
MDLKNPTVGRIVHYFPNGADPAASANGANVVPALVIQSFGANVNLHVFSMNPDSPNVLRYSIPHFSQATDARGYWDWPQVTAN